ncbi:ferredoxin NADP+ reductase-like protein [Leishmania tarentolae]|uniref:Ferredoxin NADP+ reductase-like protein n=1 Tax=Leishmania tarentolae TaxID=5689 RepID=A0A640KKR4_LEITA|nr:ferredoxin NADP+ reductase-like protein [Leishmania tarentolae]
MCKVLASSLSSSSHFRHDRRLSLSLSPSFFLRYTGQRATAQIWVVYGCPNSARRQLSAPSLPPLSALPLIQVSTGTHAHTYSRGTRTGSMLCGPRTLHRCALAPTLAATGALSTALSWASSHTLTLSTPMRWCSSTGSSTPNPARCAGSADAEHVSSANVSSPDSSTAKTTAPKRRVQIAVVGSGPSGCFVASHLVKKHHELHVDIFERLPVPFGLCRYGVAPDHPDVKNVEKQFIDLFTSGRVTWIGNVSIGKEIPLQALLEHYAAVVFATGADESKKLHIPGEDLGGVISARSFVEYYNTLPFPCGSPHFCPFDLERTKHVVVIGNGNVAMDVVRVLGASYKYFSPTDMNCVCIKELMKNQVEHISVVARRGVEHSAFATAEFREITKYQEGHVKVEVDHFDLDAAVAAMPAGKVMRAHKRMMELVHQYALGSEEMAAEAAQLATDAQGVPLPSAVRARAAISHAEPSSMTTSSQYGVGRPHHGSRGPCRLRFRYNLTPVAILPSHRRKNYVGGVLFKKTRVKTPCTETENEGEYCVVPCDLVMTSIGHRSDSIAGVPFNHHAGVIDNERGRVKAMPRVYCAGWAKNGAKGVILHSVVDAQDTAATILADMESGIIPTEPTAQPEETERMAAAVRSSSANTAEAEPLEVPFVESSNATPHRQVAAASATTTMYGKYGLVDYFVAKRLQPVSMAGLQRILHVEHERGVDLGKKAEKIRTVRDMLDVALGGDVGKKADERIRGITPARSDAMLYLKELLDDDTDLRAFAHQVARDVPHKLAQQHPLGKISPGQL